MSDERETPVEPGAAVKEQEATETAVKDAVDRAQAIVDEAVQADPAAAPSASSDAAGDASGAAAADEVAPVPTHTVITDAAGVNTAVADAQAAAEAARREAVSRIDTQLDMERADGALPPLSPEELPSAAAAPAAAALAEPARDGEIRISADHPMAALYMQSPMPPDLAGTRGAGVLIALLGTLAFAVLYAGLISIKIANEFPPSTFLTEGLLPWVTSWGFIAGVAAFFIGLTALVLIFGRAGWWAYVLFSLFVGVAVWGAATGVYALTGTPELTVAEAARSIGRPVGEFSTTLGIGKLLSLTLPTLGAGILAREVAVWFGAWIGARGRKVTAKNQALLAEYEQALAEVRDQA